VKLKSIELQGFKTFVDRTSLKFDAGITAILGPNGCGKSNIVDAVRWVLGEQSAKQLRGDRMEDIIFKGTTKRKPVGLAEVNLTFNNSDRRLPIDYDEVSIRRRVTRDGISEYYLNGTLCRLKDIRDLLYDSGVNNTAYSIIEFAMINQVLNENNQELRRIIEEGSGITKYKVRRRETQRKLDRTQQDLMRLNDIIAEIDREVRSLRYQVGKARRHQRLFRQIRALDLAVAGRSIDVMDQQDGDSRRKLDELKALAETDTGELAALRAKIEEARPALDERENEKRQLEEALQAFEEQLQEVERAVLLLEHRIEESSGRTQENRDAVQRTQQKQEEVRRQNVLLGERLTALGTEWGEMRQQVRRRSEDVALLERRLVDDRGALEKATQLRLEFIESDAAHQSRLREIQVKQDNRRERDEALAGERDQIARRQRQHEEKLAELSEAQTRQTAQRRDMLTALAAAEREETETRHEIASVQEQLSRCTATREARYSRFELIKRIKDEYQGYGQASRRVLRDHAGDARIGGSLAESIQVAADYTGAFETLFAELLDAVVVDGTDTALDLVGKLRQDKQGQASFLSRQGAASGAAEAVAAPGGGRPAREFVSGPGVTLPHLARLLARTWVFENDAAARAAADAHSGPESVLCLSRSGLLIASDGIVRGGHGKTEEVSLLGREEKLDQLGQEVVELDRRIAALQERLRRHQARQEDLRETLLRGRGELEVLDSDLRKLHIETAGLESQRSADGQRLTEIERELSELAGELAALQEVESQLVTQMDERGRERNDSSLRRDALKLAVAEAERERDSGRERVEELRLRLEKLEGEKRETETALSHLRESLAELEAERQRLSQEIDFSGQQREQLQRDLASAKSQLATGISERQRRRQLVQAAADAIQALRAETDVWHERIRQIEEARAVCREQMHELETDVATRDVRRRNLQERVEEQYQGSFGELIRSFDPEHLPRELERDGDVFQLAQAKDILVDLRGKLSSLGPVNQLALEEYEAKSERLVFLQNQLADVETAKENLITAINRINRTARKLFLETFEEVRRNFIAVFQVLFEGGRAELNLIRTDDPLESNIQIVAQPRGKIVDHVGLLSGGERCLTALSLLFAVYLVKPSPFCMLDEADAPLDDANIQRFVKMLREFSRNTQFLVVTHNKLTMETANHLYGVTMMEHGVSSIVSVNFQDVAETQTDAELSAAIASRRHDLDRRESVRAILAEADESESRVRFTLDENGVPGTAAPEDSAAEASADDEADATAAAAEEGEPEEAASLLGSAKALREMEAEG
jgi:chromosome segregation protein